MTRLLLFAAGMMLIGFALAPTLSTPTLAAPVLAVTDTNTAEPPTLTPTNTSTNTPINTPTNTPTNTPVNGATNTPTNTPGGPTETPTATGSPIVPIDPTNSATPSASPTPSPTDDDTTTDPDPDPTNSPTTAATRPPAPDPAIVKSVDRPVAEIGELVQFTLIVSNLGGSTAEGVVVDDNVPSFLDIVDVTTTKGELSVSGNAVRVTIGSLAPGEVVTIIIVARVREAPAAGQNTNVAIVMSITPDANEDNNRGSVTVDVPGAAASASPTSAAATPQPTEVPRPPTLPDTSVPPGPGSPLGMLLIGLVLIAASLFLRTARKRA
jgi:uncharacterized repeat protein (TIGR01451 family)